MMLEEIHYYSLLSMEICSTIIKYKLFILLQVDIQIFYFEIEAEHNMRHSPSHMSV